MSGSVAQPANPPSATHRMPTAMDRTEERCCPSQIALSIAAETVATAADFSGYYLCSLASSETSCPALDTSLPAPSTVLHAVKMVDAPPRTTITMKATANLLLINNSLDNGEYRHVNVAGYSGVSPPVQPRHKFPCSTSLCSANYLARERLWSRES